MGKELNEDFLVFLDLETTGLDPKFGRILEVGSVIADNQTLEVLDTRSWVVRPIGNWPNLMSVEDIKMDANDFVRTMHSVNGLWKELEQSEETLLHVAEQFPLWMKEAGLDIEKYQFTMAGNGLDRFDRPWLRFHDVELNHLDNLFHYRSLDISNLIQAFKKAGVDPLAGREKKESDHRAVQDCLNSLEDWKTIRRLIGKLK